MTWQRAILALVLAVFLFDTAWVIAQHGYLGFFEQAMANSATQLMMLDIVIALGLACIWMYLDARKRGSNAIPYIIVTLLIGSAGPLLYLVVRGTGEAEAHATA